MINRAGLLHCSERKEKHRTENGCNMGTFKTENNCALADCRGHSGIVYPKKKEERLFKVDSSREQAEHRYSPEESRAVRSLSVGQQFGAGKKDGRWFRL